VLASAFIKHTVTLRALGSLHKILLRKSCRSLSGPSHVTLAESLALSDGKTDRLTSYNFGRTTQTDPAAPGIAILRGATSGHAKVPELSRRQSSPDSASPETFRSSDPIDKKYSK